MAGAPHCGDGAFFGKKLCVHVVLQKLKILSRCFPAGDIRTPGELDGPSCALYASSYAPKGANAR